MRTKFKAWSGPYLSSHKEIAVPIDEYDKIEFKDKTYLEVGSGKGDFIIEMANKHPSMLFIGVEKNVTCAGITCKKISESTLDNIRLIHSDVEQLFPLIKDDSFDGIFLNFSDPWPKKRHTKRRLTDTRFLEAYYRMLKVNGKLYIKTDNKEFFEFSEKSLLNSEFKITSASDNYNGKDKFDAQSEYEKNFRAEGKIIYRVVAKKGKK